MHAGERQPGVETDAVEAVGIGIVALRGQPDIGEPLDTVEEQAPEIGNRDGRRGKRAPGGIDSALRVQLRTGEQIRDRQRRAIAEIGQRIAEQLDQGHTGIVRVIIGPMCA